MRNFGWKGPDLPDGRDYKYSSIRFKGQIPNVIDLPLPPVQDQREVGSCVFKAMTMCMESAQVFGANQDWWYLSALQAYYRYREIYGDVRVDDGAYIRLALGLAAKEGVCKESLWPYHDGEKWDQSPPAMARDEARNHRIESYWNLEGESKPETIDNMLSCLAQGYAFMGGVSLYDSFLSDYVAKTGKVPWPDLKTERLRGGHAMVWKGVDLHKGVFLTRNSWGEWGDHGDCEMPLEYLPTFGRDFWTVRNVTE